MKKSLWLLLCILSALWAEEVPLNILREGTFRPVIFRDMITAADGWGMIDEGRKTSALRDRIYVSGLDCFTLSSENDVFTITMKTPLNNCYAGKGRNLIYLKSPIAGCIPPAPVYHIKGKLRAQNGTIALGNIYTLPKNNEWQTIDITRNTPFSSIILTVAEGSVFSFAELTEIPEYPGAEGSIGLPDGGSLDKILLQENASYAQRLGVMLWRGWLWKLTGKALPVEIVKELKPTPNALVLMQGKEKIGRWSITIDKNGLLLTTGDPLDAYPALFDTLRRSLGCAFYAVDCEKIPAQGSIKSLPKLSFTANPVYNFFAYSHNMTPKQGGHEYGLYWTRNNVDYYHLFYTKPDHVFNLLLPQELYFKDHPEYYAADEEGHRAVRSGPQYTQQCLTNPQAMEIAVKYAVEYAKLQKDRRRLVIDVGDAKTHCLCPDCVKFNNGVESCSNIVTEFHRRVAKILEKECPQFIFERHAYATRREPPDDMTPFPDNTNMYITNLPCHLHFDCELNRPQLNRIRRLLPLVKNDTNRFSFMGYQDYRPMFVFKLAKEFTAYGHDVFFLWNYKSPHPSTSFLLGRWNLGEDPKALLQEFENAYFGKAAPFVHQAYEITEEYARNYKHTPAEINGQLNTYIWPDRCDVHQTALDRATLDKIIACYEKALAAVPDDKAARKHIYNDIRLYLTEDLLKFKPSSCKTDDERRAYAKRLHLLVNAGREFPGSFKNLMHQKEAREFLATVTGLEITNTKKNWADEPIFDKVFADPLAYLNGSGENFPGEGVYYPPTFFETSFDFTFDVPPRVSDKVVPRNNLILNPTQVMSVGMFFQKQPQNNLLLSVEGLLENATPDSSFELAMNGKPFYTGKAKYLTDSWSRMGFSIPAALLKKGDNQLTIKNLAKANGWIAISEIYTTAPGTDFINLVENRNALWRFFTEHSTPKGLLTCKNGKATITCKKGQIFTLGYFQGVHSNPKITATPGSAVTLKIKASGKGNFLLGAYRYSPYEMNLKTNQQKLKASGYTKHVGNIGSRRSKKFSLTAKEKEFTWTFTMPDNGGLFFPFITVEGDSQAVISNVDCELKNKYLNP